MIGKIDQLNYCVICNIFLKTAFKLNINHGSYRVRIINIMKISRAESAKAITARGGNALICSNVSGLNPTPAIVSISPRADQLH